MPYPTQHENFYKNQVIQLQQELEQLTETYQYRLNEENLLARAARWAVEAAARDADDIARIARINTPESLARQAAAAAAREAREAAIRALAARVEAFSTMSNDAIIAAINSGDAAFKAYVLQHYGQIVQVGSSYQRLLPDGTVLIMNANGNWMSPKPGFMSTFGYVSGSGRAISPLMWERISPFGGVAPEKWQIGPNQVDMSQYGLPQSPGGPTIPSTLGPGY